MLRKHYPNANSYFLSIDLKIEVSAYKILNLSITILVFFLPSLLLSTFLLISIVTYRF